MTDVAPPFPPDPPFSPTPPLPPDGPFPPAPPRPGAPECRFCRSADLAVVLDLGEQPPADYFPLVEDPGPDPVWPLRMGVCADCGLAQLLEDPGQAEEPLGTEPMALIEQALLAVATVRSAGLADSSRTFAEFDSPHGGSWRELLAATGVEDRTDGGGPVDLVVDVFGLMHEADQYEALRQRADRLNPGGTLLLQFHSLESIVRQGQWNALRHGHMAYYSTRALTAMLAAVGLEPRRAWAFALYGGTVLLAATRTEALPESTGGNDGTDGNDGGARTDPRPDDLLGELLARDDEQRLAEAAGLDGLGQTARTAVDALRDWLTARKEAGQKVLGYSAASRAVPLLVAAGIEPTLLAAIADNSMAKRGRAIPGVRIPIIAAAELGERHPDVVLLFVPDLLPEVRAAWPGVEAAGGRWAISEPRPHLVDPPA